MFKNKKKTILLVLASLLSLSAAGYWLARKSEVKSADKKPPLADFIPQLPSMPPLLAMDEASGELTRQVIYDRKKQQVERVEVGYKDGRKGSYIFNEGKLRIYRAFDENSRLFFEGEYERNGMLASYQVYGADARVKTLFRRLPDQSEELLFFDKDGFCIKSVLTAADGSQTTSKRAEAGKQAEVSVIKAEKIEKNYLPITLEDGSTKFRLTMQLQGVRLQSWDFLSTEGKLLHRGKYQENGELEVTFFDQKEKPALKQIWVTVGEDWEKRIYRLSALERLDSEGKLQSSILLYPDGQTPKELNNYYWGQKNSTENFDRNGFMYRQDYFDSNGSPTTSYDVQPQYRRQAKLPPQITSEAQDENGPVYELRGAPYSRPLPENGFELNPIFRILR